MQYRSTNPEGKAQGMNALPSGFVLLYCIQSEGLVNNYFLAHCFYGHCKYVFSPQELYALALRNCIIVNIWT